ncbi:VRR-NUC domain-containing protein [Spirosoma aerophilum]
MNNQNEMSADDYQRYIRQATGDNTPGKIATRLNAPPRKTQPDVISAEQYRAENVDQNEHELQVRCVDWFRKHYKNLLLFAVPNAALRSVALAAMLISEGMVSGIPDLILAYPHNGKPGLYIEMKTMKKHSKPSDEQLTIHAYLRAVGYEVAMPRTFEEFQAAVIEYLHGY